MQSPEPLLTRQANPIWSSDAGEVGDDDRVVAHTGRALVTEEIRRLVPDLISNTTTTTNLRDDSVLGEEAGASVQDQCACWR